MGSLLKTIERLQRQVSDLEAQLAAVQQGVQPYAVLVFERGEEGPFDRKPVKPDSVQHMHAKRDPHYDYVELYTHPTQQGLDAQDVSILQYLLSNAKYHEWDGGYRADFDISINADVNGVRAESAKEAVKNILAAQAKQGEQANG